VLGQSVIQAKNYACTRQLLPDGVRDAWTCSPTPGGTTDPGNSRDAGWYFRDLTKTLNALAARLGFADRQVPEDGRLFETTFNLAGFLADILVNAAEHKVQSVPLRSIAGARVDMPIYSSPNVYSTGPNPADMDPREFWMNELARNAAILDTDFARVLRGLGPGGEPISPAAKALGRQWVVGLLALGATGFIIYHIVRTARAPAPELPV